MTFFTSPVPQASADHQQLDAMARRLVDTCPDMRQMARDTANDILHKFGLGHLEPDTVYWHRFDRSVSSSTSFTGWQHLDKPIESLTLPQLVMHRFSANDQDNVDNLQMMGGFYTAGPDAETFDENNEVRLLPADVLSVFWTLDIKAQFNDRMATFWTGSADDYRTLAKANFIAKALDALEAGTLSTVQFTALTTALGLDLSQPVSLSMLQSQTPLADGIRVATLDIAGYEASDILRIVEPGGRQFLYVPGETDAIHVFETRDEMQWWLMTHTNEIGNRTQFMSHFPMSTHAEGGRGVGLHHALDLMFFNWGPHAQTVINRVDHTLSIDPFTYLRDATKARMQADSDFALHSNGELRKQMWMGYLRAFNQVFGAMAAIDWPVALAVVGAGIADVGLNIDQAVTGHTTAERKRGVTGAILGSIDVLLNSLFLVGGVPAEAGEPVVEGETEGLAEPADESSLPVEAPEPLPPGPTYPEGQDELLATFETNELLEAFASPATKGPMRGIYMNQIGETYISIEDLAYQVRHVKELNTWVIIDPQNPFSFYRNAPVRMTDAGEWELIGRPGLRGGGKFLGKLPWRGPVSSSSTSLPTTYDMPENLREVLRPDIENPNDKPFEGYLNLTTDNSALEDFFVMRENLQSDTEAFFADPRVPDRPTIPHVAGEATSKEALKQLYEETAGVVIGESHSSVASKRFLIDNMRQLAKQKVRTLYLEHLLTDLHQADLDLFATSGKMPEKLKAYLEYLDAGHHTDSAGRYTFLNLVRVANENRMRIRAIDCMTSYRLAGLPNPSGSLRIEMMNYFAHTVIRADQAALGNGKWIALVGNAHANTFQGVPGLAELEGAIGLRVEDVALGQPHGFAPDPGLDTINALGRPAGRVTSDLRLQTEVAGLKPPTTGASTSVDSRLSRVGTFIIQRTAGKAELLHRSANGSIVRTPIKSDGGRLFIERPKWTQISGRRFNSLEGLITALHMIGLKQVA
jgi:hypothetical protein